MTRYWEPGVQYNYSDVVLYEGHRYRIIQPHRSQSDWTPNVTPALWGKISDDDNNYEQQQQQQQQQQQFQPPSHPPYPGAPKYDYGGDQGPSYPEKPSNDGGSDEKKHWWDDEANKKKLEIGGGLAAGAVVAGAGYLAYKHHKEKQEEHKYQQQQFQPPSHPPYPGAPQYGGQGSSYPEKPYDDGSDKKHWWDDEANKKKLEIGGAVAGVAAAGAGYLAYKHHKEKQEEQQFEPPSNSPYPGAPQHGYGGDQGSKKPSNDGESDEKKHWWDDEANKKKLEIGGGLAAGTAVAGAGYLAYKHHKEKQEEHRSQEWVRENWIAEAQSRTEEFRRDGPRGPLTWVLTRGKVIPAGAIVVSKEPHAMYSCRTFIDGGIQLGKASPEFDKGACVGYGNHEQQVDVYEVLLGDMQGLRWVTSHGAIRVESLGAKPVEGGHENDGTPLYVARAYYKNGVHPGKASPKLSGAYVPWGGSEKAVEDYEVLCYA